ncbi:hypothetical protein MUP59_08640 [Candidatus Bathyarchaeota archaeon]|nr:hypothetical protein [Candidatus Bathyarchaeota archaeon]
MRINSMHIRKAQRVFSVALLVAIVLAVAPNVVSKVQEQVPTPESTGATRLVIFHEGYNIEVGRSSPLSIRAVDNTGEIDVSRDDLVELNLTSLSYMRTAAKLSTTTLKLENGTAQLSIIGTTTEVVRITVNWKSGRSELKSGMLTIHIGVGGE